MSHIDPYPISALLDRYKLKSKQSVYDRINALGIQPISRGKISSEQLDELDKLHNHIDAGGTIDDFVNKAYFRRNYSTEKCRAERALAPKSQLEGAGIPVERPLDKLSDTNAFIQLVHEIAAAIRPQANPIEHWFSLERAATLNLLLSSMEIKQLIGVKPVGAIFCRGSFTFIRSGKIGASWAWKVEK